MMRILVTYSSRTGNTRAVAEAICAALPEGAELFPLAAAPDPALYDLAFVGFWAKRGGPNPAAASFLKRCAGKSPACLALFGTMGARPGSAHAGHIAENARLATGGRCLPEVFLCMGKVDPVWLERRAAGLVSGKPHPMTEERAARLAEAARHPDAEDLRRAGAFARAALAAARNAESPPTA